MAGGFGTTSACCATTARGVSRSARSFCAFALHQTPVAPFLSMHTCVCVCVCCMVRGVCVCVCFAWLAAIYTHLSMRSAAMALSLVSPSCISRANDPKSVRARASVFGRSAPAGGSDVDDRRLISSSKRAMSLPAAHRAFVGIFGTTRGAGGARERTEHDSLARKNDNSGVKQRSCRCTFVAGARNPSALRCPQPPPPLRERLGVMEAKTLTTSIQYILFRWILEDVLSEWVP